MFCGKCGTKNEDNAKFCVNCGEKFNNSQMEKSEPVTKLNLLGSANDKNRKVGIAAVAIVIIMAIGIIAVLLRGRSYETTADQFVEALFNADAKTIIKLMPKALVKYMVEDEYDSRQEMIEELEEILQSGFIDAMERYIGEDWKMTHKVLDVDDLSSEKLKKIKEEYKEIVDIKISDAKKVKMELKIKAKDYDESEIINIYLIKVGRSWYVDSLNTSWNLDSIGKTLYFY